MHSKYNSNLLKKMAKKIVPKHGFYYKFSLKMRNDEKRIEVLLYMEIWTIENIK